MTTQPRLEDSGNEIIPAVPSHIFFFFKKDTQLYKLPPHTKIGPILWVRAPDFESMYDLDVLIPSPKNSKLSVGCFFLQRRWRHGSTFKQQLHSKTHRQC